MSLLNLIIAAMMISAAPPSKGVLMAVVRACSFVIICLKSSVLVLFWDTGSCFLRFLYLPNNVLVHPLSRAMNFYNSCHFFTSGLSLYQRSTVFYASSLVQFHSFIKPWTVLPYAIEKFMIFAFFLSFAYLSCCNVNI